MAQRGIVLIGMPGAGKSTLGARLARRLALDFVDTDKVIQARAGKSSQAILDQCGDAGFRALEESVLLATDCRSKVVATGGSAVYSEKGMAHLQASALVVYLQVPLNELRRRIRDYDTRGIVRRPEQSFEALFAERSALYQHYADVVIDCAGASKAQVVDRLEAGVQSC